MPSSWPQAFFTCLERRKLQDTSPGELSSIAEGTGHPASQPLDSHSVTALQGDRTLWELRPMPATGRISLQAVQAGQGGDTHMNFHPSGFPSPQAGVQWVPGPSPRAVCGCCWSGVTNRGSGVWKAEQQEHGGSE